jgi:hypothetical protein
MTPGPPETPRPGRRDWLTALLLGVCVACVLPVLSPRLGIQLIPGQSNLPLWAGLATALYALQKLPRREQRTPVGWWERLAICAAIVFVWRAFGWLVFTDPERLLVLSPNNRGDMSLHISLINYLAAGTDLWPASPILTRAPLRYPVGADLFNAMLVGAGMDTIRSLVLTGLVGAGAVFVALWRWARGFGIAAFLFAGGLAGFAIFRQGTWIDYQDAVAWKSLPLASLVTQRGLLYAIPAGLVLLDSWRARLRGGGRAPLPFVAEWLLLGMLPLFHAHSFVCLGLVLFGVLLAGDKKVRRHALGLGVAVGVPALILLDRITGGLASGGAGFAYAPGWMQPETGALVFWAVNFGILPVLLAVLAARVWTVRPAGREALAFVMPALALALLASLYRLAPWEWDNVKVYLWAYLAVLPYLFTLVLRPLPIAARAAVLVLFFFSGAVSLVGGLHTGNHPVEIAARRELDACGTALARLEPGSRIATLQTYNHPVLLAGWPVAAGYAGHLWSHGYVTRKTMEDALQTLLSGDEGWREAAARLGTRYLCWSRFEEAEFPDSKKPWVGRLPVAAKAEGFEFYDLGDLLDPAERSPNRADQPARPMASPTPRRRPMPPLETF